MKTTHFHHRCTEVAEEEGSHRAGGTRRAGSEGAAGVRAAPCCCGRCRCPAGRGCATSAARPASSSPWLPAGSCRRSRPGRPWRRPPPAGPSPGPSGRHGCGCVAPPGRLGPPSADTRASGRDGAGRRSRGRSRCERCCSNRRQNCRDTEQPAEGALLARTIQIPRTCVKISEQPFILKPTSKQLFPD